LGSACEDEFATVNDGQLARRLAAAKVERLSLRDAYMNYLTGAQGYPKPRR
jgi:hypothetical protein